MVIRFNKAQLSRVQRESLEEVLAVLQVENEVELDVSVVEFPNKFKVKLDNDVEMIVVWDTEQYVYAGLTEPIPESYKDTVDLPAPEPEPLSGIDPHSLIDPLKLAALKYQLMSAHLVMPVEKKIIFAKEYARLWSEHR